MPNIIVRKDEVDNLDDWLVSFKLDVYAKFGKTLPKFSYMALYYDSNIVNNWDGSDVSKLPDGEGVLVYGSTYDEIPKTYEGKVLATGVKDITNQSDFYLFRNACKPKTKLIIARNEVEIPGEYASGIGDGFSATTIDLSNVIFKGIQYLNSMFGNIKNTEKVIFPKVFDTSQCESLSGLFWDCPKLKEIQNFRFDTRNVKYFNRFMRFGVMESLDLSFIDFSSAEDLSNFMSDMTNLKTLKFGDVKFLKDINIFGMFYICPELELDCTDWQFLGKSVSGGTSFEYGCPGIIKPSWI